MDNKMSNNHPQDELDKAKLEDIDGMLSLNYKIYPKEWHVSPKYVKKIMQKNPEVYNILRTDAGVKGIYSFFPLNKEDYEAVLTGKMEEGALGEVILDYNTPKSVYIYLISIIVDIHDVNRKAYASKLIKNIPLELKRLAAQGIIVEEIGAIAISNEGEKILPKIGFVHSGETLIQNEKEYLIFRAKPEDILKNIKV